MPTTAIETFLTRFKWLKNRQYAKKVLHKVDIEPGLKLSALKADKLTELFNQMQESKRIAKAQTLPSVGKVVSKDGLDWYGYGEKRATVKLNGKYVPFVVEAFSFLDPSEKVIEAINFTASLHHPFTMYVWPRGGKMVALRDVVKGRGLSVLIHLVCPNITWLSPSKGELDFAPFRDASFSALRIACKQKATAGFDEQTLIEWSKEVMDHYQGIDFTVRQIFYRLVATKAYPNTQQSYKRLGEAITRGRENSKIDASRIVDLSRPEYINNPSHSTFDEYLHANMRSLMENFDLERWRNQPVFCEVWIEKEALSRLLLPICRRYRVNLIVGKGYSSYTQIYNAVKQRFPRDGKKLVILYFGDHDPSGLHIEIKLRQRIEKEARAKGISLNLDVKRIALSVDQVTVHKLPPSPLKRHGQKRDEYAAKYGLNVWELDALPPEILIGLAETEIKKIVDCKEWALRDEEVRSYQENLKAMVSEFFNQTRSANQT